MTDKHDKLVELLRETGAEEAVAGLFYVTAKDIAAFADAHVASLCADVEPVAWIESDKSGDKLGNTLIWYEINSRCEPLYPASALAALAAERDALRTALEDLTSEAVEIWEYPADYPQIEHANELIAKYKAAALTKGQP